ncbi:hypothetical protein [Candidatus Uabimicrobium sp. HlEnr_7]|uniref:hypothetical protein n=1 Tax=Candidatus Uabimicrobium helgolandensis TaxID=3095367 RepID=UPI003557177A
MKSIGLMAILLCFVWADKYPTYEDITDNVPSYYKKNVAFSFGFAGIRNKVSIAMVRRGFKNDNYGQLYANDLKLALLITKNGSAWKNIESMSRGTKLLCTGKVKRLNARSGGDFYYLVISAIKKATEQEQEEGKTTTDIKLLAKSPKEFVGKEIETEDVFIRTTNFQRIENDKYKRIQGSSKMLIVYPANDGGIEYTLKNTKKRTPLRIFGSLKEVKIKKRTKYVLVVKRIESSINEVENKSLPKNEFRKRRRRRN